MIASRRTPAQLANAIRPCCGEGGCYRRRHIRLLDKVRPSMAHTFVAELAACEAGLGREELIKIVVKTARRGLMGLARQSLREMGARGLAPSITAHNAMLEAHAVRGQWSDCLHLLTRMKQAGPEPNTVSYTTAIRASSSSPLAAELARQLLPDLEAIAQRGLAGAAALPPPEPANRRERRQALHRGLPAVTHAPPLQTPWTRSGRELERDRALPPLLAGSECAGHATRASGAEPAAGVANASYGAPRELAPTQRHSRPTIHALLGAASSEPGTALAMLTQLLDEAPFTPSGLPFTPDSGTFTAALRGCASAPGRYREALAIAKRMEAWVREDPRGRASEPELAHALTSAIAACDKASEPAEAIKLLRRFMAMGMPPATAPVTAAICSCRKAGAKGVEEATQLLALMKARGEKHCGGGGGQGEGGTVAGNTAGRDETQVWSGPPSDTVL
jgi:pentatricopeptide repeat protein